MSDTTLDRPGFANAGSTRDFGDGVSESPFGQDAGAGGRLQDKAAGLRDQATDKLRSFADEGKMQITNSIDGLVLAAREIADKLGDGSFGPVGGYAKSAVDTLEDWAGSMKNKSVEELFDAGREFTRRSPGVAVGIAVAAGFIVSRIFKAGAR